MEGLEQDTINALNHLIQNNTDAVDGFRTAAGAVEQNVLKELFMQIAEEREFMITDIQGEIVSLGGDPNEGGSFLAALHRGWINLKSTTTGHDENEVLSECIRGQQASLDEYRDALQSELPRMTRDLLQNHYDRVAAEYEQLRTLESATR